MVHFGRLSGLVTGALCNRHRNCVCRPERGTLSGGGRGVPAHIGQVQRLRRGSMTQEQWGELKKELLKSVGSNSYKNWIEPLELNGVDDGGIPLRRNPMTGIHDWIHD